MKSVHRLFSGLIVAVGLALLIGCAGTRKSDPQLQNRVSDVQGALAAITNALQFYYEDHGFFPKGMATLREAEYLALSPDVERDWDLKYYTGAGKVVMVEATSRASMPDGAGHRIAYRTQESTWEGYGITEFPER